MKKKYTVKMPNIDGIIVGKPCFDGDKKIGMVSAYDSETGLATISLYEDVAIESEAPTYVSSRNPSQMDQLFEKTIKIIVKENCPYKSWFGNKQISIAGLTGTVITIYNKAKKVRASFRAEGRTKSFDLHRKYFDFLD